MVVVVLSPRNKFDQLSGLSPFKVYWSGLGIPNRDRFRWTIPSQGFPSFIIPTGPFGIGQGLLGAQHGEIGVGLARSI